MTTRLHLGCDTGYACRSRRAGPTCASDATSARQHTPRPIGYERVARRQIGSSELATMRGRVPSRLDITPFEIAVADEVLKDLKGRLRRTRWPEAETVDDWSQGIPPGLRAGSLRLLGERVRLAGTRAGAQPVRPVHRPRRRHGRALHSRPITRSRRRPGDNHARLARLGGGVSQGHRAVDQPSGSRGLGVGTRSMWCARRCRASASAASPPAPAGASTGSPTAGRS